MQPVHIKIGLFVLLWQEVAACFRCGADVAFLATIAVFFGTAVVRSTGVEIAMLSGRLTAMLVAWGLLWIVVYLSLAPAFIRALPISIIVAAVIGTSFAGAWAHDAFFVWVQDIDRQWFHDRSEAIVCSAMGAVALAGLSHLRWGSVLPLIGCLLLPGLPFTFGWLAARPQERWRFDASLGTFGLFRDVGASDEY